MALKAFACLCLCFQGAGALKLSVPVVDGPWNTVTHSCKNMTNVGFDIDLCKDGWDAMLMQHKGKPCIVYDMGVRHMADLALKMIENFGCKVRAYDPSKVTAQWYDNDKNAPGAGIGDMDVFREEHQEGAQKLHKHAEAGNYKLWKEAAAEKDGNLTLYEFAWQQVSNLRASSGNQKSFTCKAKSLPTMLKDNDDTYIDLLKVDIEGSEMEFLKGAFDHYDAHRSCPPVEHMLLEWHSQGMDKEQGAPPEVIAMEKRMEKCGYKKYATYPFFGPNKVEAEPNEPDKPQDWDMKGTYYGHAAYCRNCV